MHAKDYVTRIAHDGEESQRNIHALCAKDLTLDKAILLALSQNAAVASRL